MLDSITFRDPLMAVEVRHLVALSHIARTGSFSAAARELGYAQSAVSQQIATLEKAAGHRLLERPGGPRRVTLTEAGALILQHADAIVGRLGALRADLDGLGLGTAGRLRIGVFQSASARLLPAVLPVFRRKWPVVEITLRNVSEVRELERAVLAGELDIAFCELGDVDPDLEAVELLVDPYVALLNRDHPLAARDCVSLADFDGLDRIAPSNCESETQLIMNALAGTKITTRVVFETDDNLTLQRLVGAGMGVAIVPSLAVEHTAGDDTTVVRPFDAESQFNRRIGLVFHRQRYRSPATAGFVAAAVEVLGDASR